MCYDSKSQPPLPPGERGEATTQDLVLTASDGNPFNAFLATPTREFHSQVLIYPDIRGLHQFYKDLAVRFAEMGVRALTFDFYGRTGGLTARDDNFVYRPHADQITLPTFFADVAAALDYLQKDSSRIGSRAKTFVLGFCIGGALTVMTGTQNFDLAGLIPFYAGITRNFGSADGTILQQAHKVLYPVLGLFGGADQGIPVEKVQELDAELDKANVEHELIIYPGAPHSFFDRKFAEFANESADAWARVLGFIQTYS